VQWSCRESTAHEFTKGLEMKSMQSVAMGLAAATGLALAATLAVAHPGGGWGMGMGMGAGPGSGPGMGYGMGGMMMGGGPGACANAQGGSGPFAGQPLFTVEEMTAHRDAMRNATTVEQRQQLMTAHRTEMQRRAAERGITCPGLAAAPGK
jgi:hypothetical protein